MEPLVQRVATGAEIRVRGGDGDAAVVCVNGGQAAEVEGTWSATLEWLVTRLAPRFPELRFVEVRYRVKSWRRLDLCVEDAGAALDAAHARRVLLLGFSMGGAVAASVAGDPRVDAVVGLAPWLPDRLDLSGLAGRRLAVVQGSLDRALPGIPGVSAASSRRGFERARPLVREAEYTLLRGGLHGAALRRPWGSLQPLPRARAWERAVAAELERFRARLAR